MGRFRGGPLRGLGGDKFLGLAQLSLKRPFALLQVWRMAFATCDVVANNAFLLAYIFRDMTRSGSITKQCSRTVARLENPAKSPRRVDVQHQHSLNGVIG